MRLCSIVLVLFFLSVDAFTYGRQFKFNHALRYRGGQFGHDIQVSHSSIAPLHETSNNEPSFFKDTIKSIGKPSQSQFLKNILGLKFMENFYTRLLKLAITDVDVLQVIAKSCTYASFVLIAISVLGTLGFDVKVFLSILSIASLTVGFAAKDVLANTIAGMILLISKPFTRGSIIRTCGYKGTVMSVDARYVHLYDHALQSNVLIPLGMVYSQPVIIDQP